MPLFSIANTCLESFTTLLFLSEDFFQWNNIFSMLKYYLYYFLFKGGCFGYWFVFFSYKKSEFISIKPTYQSHDWWNRWFWVKRMLKGGYQNKRDTNKKSKLFITILVFKAYLPKMILIHLSLSYSFNWLLSILEVRGLFYGQNIIKTTWFLIDLQFN